MVSSILKDPYTYLATVGTSLMVSIQYVAENFSPFVAFIGGILGLVMLILGISEKVKANKVKTLQIRKLTKELNE